MDECQVSPYPTVSLESSMDGANTAFFRVTAASAQAAVGTRE